MMCVYDDADSARQQPQVLLRTHTRTALMLATSPLTRQRNVDNNARNDSNHGQDMHYARAETTW